MFLPVIAALLAVAFFMRRKILRVWREGAVVDGEVVELRTYAIAPLSRRVKYKLTDPAERRLFSALWPNRAGTLAVGQRVKLLVGKDGRRSVLAPLYAGHAADAASASSASAAAPPAQQEASQ
jgi:hypothetical protein